VDRARPRLGRFSLDACVGLHPAGRVVDEVRQDCRSEGPPGGISPQFGALLGAMGEVVISLQEDYGVEDAGFLCPTTDELGVTRDDSEPIRSVDVEKFNCLARLHLIGPHLVYHACLPVCERYAQASRDKNMVSSRDELWFAEGLAQEMRR
jgi:hypothetical protein